MICEECGERPANVHVTSIINGEVSAQHLCIQCAKEKGEYHFMADPSLMIQNLMAGLAGAGTMAPPAQGLSCPSCGLPFSQFQATGRLGCTDCYESFKELLKPVIARVQAGPRHRGKIPAKLGPEVQIQQELLSLREELAGLVKEEAYEKAASVRDRIRSLEDQQEGDQKA